MVSVPLVWAQEECIYTSLRKIAYPKPGYSNPTVKVFVVDLVAQKRIELPEPAALMKMWEVFLYFSMFWLWFYIQLKC